MANRYGSSDLPLVQWSFLQFKKTANKGSTPVNCFLHSATQIGSKILIYGGCDYYGDGQSQLFLYDTATYTWSQPSFNSEFQEDNAGARYGHTATLIEMHPPKIMIYGGVNGNGTFEFDAPDGVDGFDKSPDVMERTFMKWRRKGRRNESVEESDDAVYFLTLKSEEWVWSKPIVHGNRSNKPPARCEHSVCKTGTNEVTIFGGWTDRPMNDCWAFNYVDMEWKQVVTSGIQPRPRYRHTAEIIGNKMYILGGSENGDDIADGSRHLGVHVLNLSTMEWSHPAISGINPFPRSGHSSAVIGAKSIAIFGGKRNNEVYLNDIILLDVESFNTTLINAVETHLPTPVSNASLTAVGNKLLVFGGTDTRGACYNDIRLLDVGYYLNANDITVNEGASSDYNFKIIIIGDASVGKSALLTRFSENMYLDSYTSTIGIDFNSRMIRVDRAICKLEIWDTAGQERFSTITANYYRGAQGALLVYDVGLRDSFEHIQRWYDRAKQLGGEDLEVIIIGNKSDLSDDERQVSIMDGEQLAQQLGNVPFVETSALNGSNVEAAFVTMTSNIKKSVDRRGLSGIKTKHLQTAGSVTLANAEGKMSMFSRCGCR
jgi:Ras-related protein Rab-1A